MTETGRADAPISSSWTQFAQAGNVPKGAVYARAFVGGNGATGSCVLIEDVTLTCP